MSAPAFERGTTTLRPTTADPDATAPRAALRDTTDLDAVRAEIAARFAEREHHVARYGPELAHLWRLTAEQARGGKLLRPLLLVRAHAAMSAATGRSLAPPGEVRTLASALELLHFSFLLHDDVIDGDLFRRGHLNLVGTLAAEREPGRSARDHATSPSPEGLHWGQTGAILAGNLLLSHVHQVFARLDVDAPVRTALLDLLDHAITETVAGEHADVALSDGVTQPRLETILDTAVRKTATYSFALPLRLAAVLADAPAAWHERLDAAAHHLGLAFQLQDDYLSTFGDAARHGKDPFSDLREGKETAIIAFARLTSAWPRVRSCFGDRTLGEREAQRAVAALRACGADRFVLGLVAEHREALGEVLSDDGGPQDERLHEGCPRAGDPPGAPPSAPAMPPELRDLLGALDAELVGRAA